MPIKTTCPECKALFNLPHDLAGTRVRCAKCKHLFLVPAPLGDAPPTPAAEPAAPPMPDDVAEASPDEVPSVEPKVEPKPAPPKAPAQTERSPSVLVGLALLLLFVLSAIGVVALAIVWIGLHLGPPLPPSAKLTLPVGDKDNQRIDVNPKKLPPGMRVDLGAGGVWLNNQGLADGRGDDDPKWGQHGPYRLFRVTLQQGATYHFYVESPGFTPRLRILDDDKVRIDRAAIMPQRRILLAFRPDRAGEYLIWVTNQERVFANFDFKVSIESRLNPIQVDLTGKPGYSDFRSLRLDDPLDPAANTFGPYRDYEVTLAAGVEYEISILNPQFNPVLRIDDNIVRQQPGMFGIRHPLRPPADRKYRFRVTSADHGLGNYTLSITPKITLQTLNRALDAEGKLVDMQTFVVNDARIFGQGSYKSYLVRLEKGKRYRIEMAQGPAATSVTVFDPLGLQAAAVINQHAATVIHAANHTGVYRINVAGPLDKQQYTFRITTEP